MQLYILYESASGYCLFEKEEFDETGGQLKAIQKAIPNLERFAKMIKLAAFQPFSTAEEALENITAVAKNTVPETLKNFLTANLPATKAAKKQKFLLGIADPKLGQEIFAETGVTASFNESIEELNRGIRTHLPKLLKKLSDQDMTRAQLGLAHQYSREQCATDVNRQDKPIIQTIALIETMDKNINTFVMRLKEWFSWHFPELGKIVTDNSIFCKVVNFIQTRENVTEDIKDELAAIVLDEEKADQIIEAAKISMGQELSEADVVQVKKFAERVVEQIDFRDKLQDYLKQRMNAVAPNLTALIGEMVGSKLISHSGSLINLAKYPASTIQILGAEKALFRALKTKGKTPKYGLIFNSSFIGRAGQKNKGRISRYLANKCAIAARIDSFTEKQQSNAFGEKLKEQMEERLQFLATGAKPKKNTDAMKEVLDELKAEGLYYDGNAAAKKADKSEKKKDKKRKREESSDEEEEIQPKKKKSKKA
jgi:nucleolar protein 56